MLSAATAEKASTIGEYEFIHHAGKQWPVLQPNMIDISRIKDPSGRIKPEYLFEVKVSGRKVPLVSAPGDCAIAQEDGSYAFLRKGELIYLEGLVA